MKKQYLNKVKQLQKIAGLLKEDDYSDDDNDSEESSDSESEDTDAMGGINEKSIDPNKRKVYIKAAIEMAQSYAKRGYTQDEAVKDAAQGIKNVYGYELTDVDRQAVKHFVPVHGNFK